MLGILGAALSVPAAAGAKSAFLELPDGRRVRGLEKRTQAGAVVLETAFGPLRVPNSLLRPPHGKVRPQEALPPRGSLRKTTSKWFEIESDLAASRVRKYHEALDAFLPSMITTYGLDRKQVLARAPYRLTIYRSHADFKRVQEEKAPGIEAAKGKGFAEGVAGWYSGNHIYMWDYEGSSDEYPNTALHEMTHWLNTMLTGTRFPVWFEEGSATYFEMFTPAAEEPEPNLAALGTVVGAIRSGHPMTNLHLRSIAYAKYRGYEYAWGWAAVSFLRRYHHGALWKPLLKYIRAASSGAPSASENKRFLKAVGFRSMEAFDDVWWEYLRGLAQRTSGLLLGGSAKTLNAIAHLPKPTPDEAVWLFRFGRSFLQRDLPEAAMVYLEAAARGGLRSAEVLMLLARARAERHGLGEEAPWPEASVRDLEEAVRAAPLSSYARTLWGIQRLLHAKNAAGAAHARDTLGMALLLLGSRDDDLWTARWALEAVGRADPSLSAPQCADWLVDRVPEASDAIRRAQVYRLQEAQRWPELIAVLEARRKAGKASVEERTMLAGLYWADDRMDDAATIYGELLEERPCPYHLWPNYLRALVAAGRLDEARKAQALALKQLAGAPGDAATVRRLVERVRID